MPQNQKSKIKNQNDKSKFKKTRIVGGHPTADWVNELPSRHTRVIIQFDKGTLYFNDLRVFGWMKVIGNQDLKFMIQDLPLDVVDPKFTVGYLEKVLEKSRRAVKLVIMDQGKMGGMGNIYANDALWLARIHPEKRANELKKKEVMVLHRAMVDVLKKGIELGGATYSDYVDTEGLGGKYQEHFLVYDREGEKCGRKGCKGVIKKTKLGGRGTYFCSGCQRL